MPIVPGLSIQVEFQLGFITIPVFSFHSPVGWAVEYVNCLCREVRAYS